MPAYLVTGAGADRVVEAPTKSAAINHVIRDTIKAETLSTEKLLEKVRAGVTVEKAGPDLSKHTDAPVNRSEDVKAMDAKA